MCLITPSASQLNLICTPPCTNSRVLYRTELLVQCPVLGLSAFPWPFFIHLNRPKVPRRPTKLCRQPSNRLQATAIQIDGALSRELHAYPADLADFRSVSSALGHSGTMRSQTAGRCLLLLQKSVCWPCSPSHTVP